MAEIEENEAAVFLARVEQLYALDDPTRFARHALDLLLAETGATAGYGALRSTAGFRLLANVGGDLTLARSALADGLPERLGSDTPVRIERTDGPLAAPFPAGVCVTLCAPHREVGTSVWILMLPTAPSAAVKRQLDRLVPCLGYAGEILLPLGLDRRRDTLKAPREDLFQAETDDEPPGSVLDGLPQAVADCGRLAARGYSNNQIAVYLGLTEGTVARYLNRVYRHLGIEGRHLLDIGRILRDPKPAPRSRR
ncbi:MAG: helix-turn-helix transcriptional regulator [Myxococcales bacterium]|nr:helix-turn-helix transcriptional regulator [Myxococcales bacterium]